MREGTRAWEWGPEVVHEECRVTLKTPLDEQPSYVSAWERIKA